LTYELLDNPRYEYDTLEIENIRQRNYVIRAEFGKCISIVSDDNIKSLFKTIKSNYEDQFKELVANAERSLKTIDKIKHNFEKPIEEMIKKLGAQEYEFTSEAQKQQREIEEYKLTIGQLTQKVQEFKTQVIENKDVVSKNEKRVVKELKVANTENKQMKDTIEEYKEEVDYCKQRENKLMYFLYVMKEKGLPVGEIFESEIKDIPTKRFSKYFDDDSGEEEKAEKGIRNKYQSLTERIFPPDNDPVVSDTTSIMPITNEPAAIQKRHSIVPLLALDHLPPRHTHYFSEDSKASGMDISFEQHKTRENASLAKKYDLTSFCDRMKQKKLKNASDFD
jgi:hypothetical protein